MALGRKGLVGIVAILAVVLLALVEILVNKRPLPDAAIPAVAGIAGLLMGGNVLATYAHATAAQAVSTPPAAAPSSALEVQL